MTFNLPDSLAAEAIAAAQREGRSLDDFIASAVRSRSSHGRAESAWERHFGALSDLHEENLAIDRVIQAEFRNIEEAMWR